VQVKFFISSPLTHRQIIHFACPLNNALTTQRRWERGEQSTKKTRKRMTKDWMFFMKETDQFVSNNNKKEWNLRRRDQCVRQGFERDFQLVSWGQNKRRRSNRKQNAWGMLLEESPKSYSARNDISSRLEFVGRMTHTETRMIRETETRVVRTTTTFFIIDVGKGRLTVKTWNCRTVVSFRASGFATSPVQLTYLLVKDSYVFLCDKDR
jgi:hypothetical protein